MLKSDNLVFIISQPRSGSTLTQKLLSNNNEVDTVSEPWLLLPYLSVFRTDLVKAEYNADVARKGIDDYLDKKNLKSQYNSKLKEFLLSMYSLGEGKKYFVDKTPRYYEILNEIYSMFPEAKFLILKRNPFASLYSMLQTWSALKVDEISISTFYRDFLIAPFRINDFATLHANKPNFKIVQYEDIVADPEIEVRGMYDWLKLRFSESVLEVGNNEKVKGLYGDDVYKRKNTGKIQSDSINEWKCILENKKLKDFFYEYQSYLTKEFILKYGYESLPESARFFNIGDKNLRRFIAKNQLL